MVSPVLPTPRTWSPEVKAERQLVCAGETLLAPIGGAQTVLSWHGEIGRGPWATFLSWFPLLVLGFVLRLEFR